MPRPLRVEYEGARYHVMCRGNRGAHVFEEPRDKEIYLDTLAEAVERTGWQVHAWVGTRYRRVPREEAAVAGWLKRHFCVTNRWLSQHLHMGHPTRVSRSAVFYRSVPRKWRATRRKLEDSLRVEG